MKNCPWVQGRLNYPLTYIDQSIFVSNLIRSLFKIKVNCSRIVPFSVLFLSSTITVQFIFSMKSI